MKLLLQSICISKNILYIVAVLILFSCHSFYTLPQKHKIKDFSHRSYDHFSESEKIKIGFGSCLQQDSPMPIFNSIRKDSLDLFFMIGDNVYGDTEREDLYELKLAYKKQMNNFNLMNLDFPIEAIWDDHDYGRNDGGRDYPYKQSSEELFLEFWNIPKHDIRWTRPGIYFELVLQTKKGSLQILFLDTRTFRDPLVPSDKLGTPGKERYLSTEDTSLTMLGKSQWKWVSQKLSQAADYRIIVSSIQFLPIGHGWEAWNNLPNERRRMIDIIDRSNSKNILFISGDRHRGGFYQLQTEKGKTISELTSSSLNASFFNGEEFGPLRIGNTFVEENYGVIIFDNLKNRMSVTLKNKKGEILQSLLIEN
jgi:alkaline phosphatase D